MDTGEITMNGLTIDIHDLTTYAGQTEARVSASDGSAAGILNSYTVSNTGQIVGVFSNGLKQTLGQLALANFNNVNGLEKMREWTVLTLEKNRQGSGGLDIEFRKKFLQGRFDIDGTIVSERLVEERLDG